MNQQSFMGVEILDQGLWLMVGARLASHEQATEEAPKLISQTAPGAEHRVRRLSKKEYEHHLNLYRLHPAFQCPECPGIMVETDTVRVFRCKRCNQSFKLNHVKIT